MFEQSQLELASKDERKPVSMIAGFALQATLVAGALLFSLMFTEAVPRLRFDVSLMAPPRARQDFIAIQQPDVPRRPVPVNFKPRPSGLVTPTEIPRETLILDKLPVVEPEAPDIYSPGFLPRDGSSAGPGSTFLMQDLGTREIPDMVAPPPPPAPKPNVHPAEPVRMGGDVAAAKLIHRVQPVYPALARQARIQGTVRLEAVISESGDIVNLRVLSGHPLLIQVSIDAVEQWRSQPTMLNGQPVAVITTVDVNFKLGGN